METVKSEKCVICGERAAVTRDHVPPKNLFPKPRPNDLVTVPACSECNNGSSVEDEDFRTYLSFQIGLQSHLTEKLWFDGAKKSLERRKSLQQQIIASLRPIMVETKTGITSETAFEVPERVYVRVFERVVRGLYFHHFKKILGKEVPISISPLVGIDDNSLKLLEEIPVAAIGDPAFVYKYAVASDDENSSLWVMQLYEAHWIEAVTGSAIDA